MILVLVLIIVIGLGIGALLGAPYLPMLRPELEAALKELHLKPGQTLIDLGCGDGRVLKAAAKRGVKGIGYEISPWLALAAKINCWPQRRLVQIKWANYWNADLPKADAIFVFLISRYMSKLDKKLCRITYPATVLSYIYAIPGRHPTKEGPNYFLYRYP